MSKGCMTGKQSEFENSLTANTVSFTYMVRNYAAIPDSLVKVTSEEIRSYYDKHKDSFKRGATRDMEYIAFDIAPSESDMKETENWANNEKEHFASATDLVQLSTTADTRTPVLQDSLTSRHLSAGKIRNSVLPPLSEDGAVRVAALIYSRASYSVRAPHSSPPTPPGHWPRQEKRLTALLPL